MKSYYSMISGIVAIALSADPSEIFNEYPNQPSDEELEKKYTVLQTFIFPAGRGFLVKVNESYEFPMANPSLNSAQSKYHQNQTDEAIARAEELVATIDYELEDRALVLVGNFTADQLPDVMIQRNVPVESGAIAEDGSPIMETVWFANVPTTEIISYPMRNLSDSVADPAYRVANDFQTYPDFRTKD